MEFVLLLYNIIVGEIKIFLNQYLSVLCLSLFI